MQLACSKYGVRLLEQDCCDKSFDNSTLYGTSFRCHVYDACRVCCNFQNPTSYDKTQSKKQNVYLCLYSVTCTIDLHGAHFTKFQGVLLFK